MKKASLLIAVVILLCNVSKAQIQQGNVLVGGDLGGLSLGLNGDGYFNLSLNPKAAWFVRDNIAIGAYAKLGISTAKNAGTTTMYGVGPIARYYINDPKVNPLQHARFFFEGNVGIEGSNYSKGSSTNGLGLGIGPGLAYFITPNIGLETLLKYDGIVGFGSQATTGYLDLNVGFQVYLPTAKLKSAVRGNSAQ